MMKLHHLSIKTWIILLVNMLIILTTAIVSIYFYSTFQNTLNERVLLQLTSIKKLKKIQIEDYINDEWDKFKSSDISRWEQYSLKNGVVTRSPIQMKRPHFVDSLLGTSPEPGIYDITKYSDSGRAQLLFIKEIEKNHYAIKVYEMQKIKRILLERTGMGNSGETYIVGSDLRLRSLSRFYPDKKPYDIIVNTIGVQRTLQNKNGRDIFLDYRGIPVYSAYNSIKFDHFTWVILSEMDVEEVMQPLESMRRKLLLMCLTVIILSVFLSLIFINKISMPIVKTSRMLRNMSRGDYEQTHTGKVIGREIDEMVTSLKELQMTLGGATEFAKEIGEMNLNVDYEAVSKNDTLGHALLMMRDRLKAFQRKEIRSQQRSKQSLITGQENERKRLSKELHDGLGPLLTSLKLMVQSATLAEKEKIEVKKLLDDIITETRRISYNLMPQSLIDFGVGDALMNWIEVIKKTSDLDIEYINSMKGSDSVASSEVNVCLFRVSQELINNAIKHAKASKIKLSLTEFDDKVSLYYQDNGIGFDSNQETKGSGLKNIRERISILDGYISMNTEERGTEIEVEIPIILSL